MLLQIIIFGPNDIIISLIIRGLEKLVLIIHETLNNS
jgi:hypothetical protein